MKKLSYSSLFLFAFLAFANAQIGIETNVVSPKAILDFPDNAVGGILLPYVEETSTAGNTGGTILYNAKDGAVYVFKTDEAKYVALTKPSGSPVKHDTSVFKEATTNSGFEINDTNNPSNAQGALVLESNQRALALPKVNGVENIQSPKPGMICYDVSRKALAIFNGKNWTLRN